MLNRRIILGALAAGIAFTAPLKAADDWKVKYPEVTFAIVPLENAGDTLNRWNPFADYLSKELGVKVTIRIAQDYAAVIEGQRAGNVQIGYYGAASFARARLTGVNTEAFATDLNKDGSTGYYSVFYVLSKSPYQKIEDLKSKNLGLVDPNSTSGNNVPRFELNKRAIKPEDFFAKVVYAGSHENAVLALAQGTVDVAANQWTNDNDSTLQQMLTKGILKHDDGTPFKNLIWRGLGVRVGRRVFDDGCYLTERTLTTIGDDCMLNANTKIQCHSQEDGTFKSDRSTLGAGCTLGVGAIVHYGETMGAGAVLAPDTFLMKGEDVPEHARWGGNPAREM